jgi:hypothetical protein
MFHFINSCSKELIYFGVRIGLLPRSKIRSTPFQLDPTDKTNLSFWDSNPRFLPLHIQRSAKSVVKCDHIVNHGLLINVTYWIVC